MAKTEFMYVGWWEQVGWERKRGKVESQGSKVCHETKKKYYWYDKPGWKTKNCLKLL